MPRISRAVAVGYPHHITQRGNYRQDVFQSDEDYKQYLQWLKKYSDKYALKIWAYCLMSNHVHYVAVPLNDDSLAKTFNTLHMMYSRYFNQKSGGNGHLWQGRFFSCVLDEPHVYAAVRYVENNPVRAKMVDKAEDYLWSSAVSHLYKKSDPVLTDDCYLADNIRDWRMYLNEKENSVMTDTLFQNTKTGRPCGTELFISQIESIVGRRLSALPPGRPRKTK
ncbi:MAG: transposase [Nitrospirae bacterium]|nr:MAG: transposase [Nitrospirota bacterium]